MKNNHPDICMLVGNSVTQDPRVRKEAETLTASGYSLVILGFKLTSQDLNEEIFTPGYRVNRIDVSTFNTRFKKLIKSLSSGRTSKLKKITVTFCELFVELYQMFKLIFKAVTIRAKIYHAHDLDTLPAAYLASLRFRGKLIYDSHELFTEQREYIPSPLKFIMQWVERHLIKKATGVITVNQSIAMELSKRYSVPMPLSLRNFMKKVSFEESLASNMVQLGEIRVLYHGGYQKGRGLEEVIKSVVYWEENIKLYLRGYGPIENILRELVRANGFSDRVHFLEPVPMDRLIEEAAFAHIGVLPYKPSCLNNLYSLPNKLFEYMMSGLAVVASDLPEIRRLNDEVDFGLLFNPKTPESIADTVNKMARDRALLEKCQANALRWSRSVGNWEKESEKLVFIYRTLINRQEDVCG